MKWEKCTVVTPTVRCGLLQPQQVQHALLARRHPRLHLLPQRVDRALHPGVPLAFLLRKALGECAHHLPQLRLRRLLLS